MLDNDEFSRWISTARETLESATSDLENEFYNWACFKAQQAAGFAVKALMYGLGFRRGGHSITILLKQLSEYIEVPTEVFEAARMLDKLYIPTRYPDVWGEGTPMDYYTEADCREALTQAWRLLKWVEETWGSLRRGGK